MLIITFFLLNAVGLYPNISKTVKQIEAEDPESLKQHRYKYGQPRIILEVALR